MANNKDNVLLWEDIEDIKYTELETKLSEGKEEK